MANWDSVYRKKTHMNRYVKASSHHHPVQINAVVGTLRMRSSALSDEKYRNWELGQIKQTLLENRSTWRTIRNLMWKKNRTQETCERGNRQHQLHLNRLQCEICFRALQKTQIDSADTIRSYTSRKPGCIPNTVSRLRLNICNIHI